MTDTHNLTINTGVRLTINDDPERVVSFNPGDVNFAERFYNLIREFESKQADYQARADVLDEDKAEDAHGLPVNLSDRIAFMRDVCGFMHAQIDHLFGDGTAKAVFQDAKDIDAVTQFFEGIAPYVERDRKARVEKYQPRRHGKASKVMK